MRELEQGVGQADGRDQIHVLAGEACYEALAQFGVTGVHKHALARSLGATAHYGFEIGRRDMPVPV